jgi:hypothetical protein
MNNSSVKFKELSPALEIRLNNGRKSIRRSDGKESLPGQPRIQIQGEAFAGYIRKSHLVSELDKLAPYLRFVGVHFYLSNQILSLKHSQITTPSSAHIYPLHEYFTRGRTVNVTEYPGLHLVWYYDKIFIKPIPPYLLCGAFWEYLEEADKAVWKAAAGFMRTYYYLIQYEIDFRKATSSELQLIPQLDCQAPITFEEFAEFIAQFHCLGDHAVAPRYSYGALRLTRLNHLSRVFLRKWTYFHLHPQWSDNLGRFVAPIVFLFAILSTILSSMQVVLATQGSNSNEVWPAFLLVSKWFSVVVILVVALILVGLVVVVVVMLLKDGYFAWTVERRLKGGKEIDTDVTEMKSAVI